MHLTAIKLATFAAAALTVVGVVSVITDLVLRDKSRIRDRLREHFGTSPGTRSRKSDLFKDLTLLPTQTPRTGLWTRFVVIVEQSGIEVEPEKILQIALTFSIVGLILGYAISRIWIVGFATAVTGLVAPIVYVFLVRKARIQNLCQQLPEAFELMSRAVKAGQTMPAAMNLVATQLKAPISVEFASCCEQQNLGLSQEIALQELARRTGVMELQMFVVAMLVQRRSGGNPIEILENLSEVIRKRVRLVGKVRACTGEGRMQAVVLSVLPVLAFVALLFLNRTYAQILLDRPKLLMAVVGWQLVGVFWIRRIINFQY
ncbi:MAG TPA: type II secretion system F family protein [Planctomycetaceae bacterium]|jgi:tight adherence protein B|nr:type II secretion system F family protein [Planctomycetaceae bacterium]